MLGKPHTTSFPENTFTVKDGKSVNSERECLNSASFFTATATVSLFYYPAIAADSHRNNQLIKINGLQRYFDSWR